MEGVQEKEEEQDKDSQIMRKFEYIEDNDADNIFIEKGVSATMRPLKDLEEESTELIPLSRESFEAILKDLASKHEAEKDCLQKEILTYKKVIKMMAKKVRSLVVIIR